MAFLERTHNKEDTRKKEQRLSGLDRRCHYFRIESGLDVYDSASLSGQRGFGPGHFSGFVVRRALRRFVLAKGCHLRKGGRSGSDRTCFHGWTPYWKM